MGDDSGSRPPLAVECGEDRISCLPDELLHGILTCLGSTRAAARTSVLSSRWRHVWTYLPKICMPGNEEPPPTSSFLDAVDAALAANAAPTLHHLSISVPDHGPGTDVLAQRVAPWLRFASKHVAGDIFLHMGTESAASDEELAEIELELPACGAATAIVLTLKASWKLRPAGVFAALTDLEIFAVCMDGRELSDLVSIQCPRLKMLHLLVELVDVFDVSMHSDSLHKLLLTVANSRRIEVVASRLEELTLMSRFGIEEIDISAPKLAKVTWYGVYDPRRYQFTHVCRRLRLLRTMLEPNVIPLMKQFDEVGELKLHVSIRSTIASYESFLNETKWLSKCETLNIILSRCEHSLVPVILHLFRCCNRIKKLSTRLLLRERDSFDPSLNFSLVACLLDCPCRLPESCRIDDIAFNSLEEVEMDAFVGSHEEMVFVEQLSRCNAPVLKKLVINCPRHPAPRPTKETCERVRSMCRPDLKVEFYVMSRWRSEWRRVRFD